MMVNKKASIFLKYIATVLIMMLLGGLVMFGLAKHRQSTFYTANRAMVISHTIHQTQESDNDLNSSDQQMMITYKKIAEDPIIAKKARTYLPRKMQKKYSVDDLNKMVDSKVSQQSLMLVMRSKAGNKKDTVATVNAMAKAMKKELPVIQPGAGKVRLLAPATLEETERITVPHVKKYIAVGLALGGMVGLIICFVDETWKRLL